MSALSIRPTTIPEVLEITPPKFGDDRGYFTETFRKSWLQEHGFSREFIQDNQSYSAAQGVLRGLHFQSGTMAQDKLVRCLQGQILDVAVDIRHGSPTYGQHVSAILSAETGNQLLVPIGFAHGFMTLVSDCIVAYKTSNFYSPEHDKGMAWDDNNLSIAWPENIEKQLSTKDQAQPTLTELPRYFGYQQPGYTYDILLEK